MRGTIETGSHLEPDYEAETTRRGLQTVLGARRGLIAGAVLLALMVGSAPAADAATSTGDNLVQNQRFCWWSSC